MSYSEFSQAQRRLRILELLRDGGEGGDEKVLLVALREVGFPRATADQVRADLDALRACGLLTVEWWHDRIAVARLTDRGLETAAGRIEVDGIAKPARVG